MSTRVREPRAQAVTSADPALPATDPVRRGAPLQTPFAPPLDPHHRYPTRRLTAHGAKLSACPAFVHARALLGPKERPTEPVVVSGQAGWAHDEGHLYGTFHTFDALTLGGKAPHKIHVLLPRGYGAGQSRHPVLYMHDGGNVFFDGAPGGKSWRVADTLSGLKAAGRVGEPIVVAIHPRNRALEYLPGPKADEMRLPEFTEWVAGELAPFIDKSYRTQAERATIAGSSHGGFAAFWMATRRPDRFGNAVCMSSSFWRGLDLGAGGGALEDSALVRPVRALLSDPSMRPRLWIDWGLVRTGGQHNDTIERLASERGEEMVDLLVSQHGYTEGVDLIALEDPEGEHEENSWQRRFASTLEALYPPP